MKKGQNIGIGGLEWYETLTKCYGSHSVVSIRLHDIFLDICRPVKNEEDLEKQITKFGQAQPGLEPLPQFHNKSEVITQ